MITFDERTKTFHLFNDQISYLMEVEENNYLAHLYFGKRVTNYSGNVRYPRIDRSFSPNPPNATDRLFSLDTLLMEYPGNGFGDFREPAHHIFHQNGNRLNDFRYVHFDIIKGKPHLEGLPATYASDEEAETLIITLEDDVTNLQLRLFYTIFAKYNVITRSNQLINKGNTTVNIHKLASQSLDFPNRSFELIHLNGAWGRERQMTREKVTPGVKRLDSKRGSSSHQQNPFAALVEPTTMEFQGEAYGFSFVYSGNHEIIVQKDPYAQTRVIMGINSFDFNWNLAPKDMFQTPEAVLVYSSNGLNQMSETFHDLFNHQLIRGKFKLQERPVLINNWEATYFDFDETKLTEIVDQASDLGIEMFVLDDGWFGKRKDDYTSLGDWFEYEGKIKSGLKRFAEKVHQKDMQFGIWFEPEMVSVDSELYREHPDWVLGVPDRGNSPSRSQLVLDFSRADVRENIYQKMQAIFNTVDIDYVKWDMNRNMTEVHSLLLEPEMQGEVAHRYMLGLYEFMEKLTNEYPEILFEGCSGGGGRFDPGFLYYMPQYWTSDNTDAIARLKIQYGTSLVYPISTMGSHVSAVPNHQTGRNTSMTIRGNVAMSGVFGYELDLTQLSIAEKTEIKEQVNFYKQHRRLLQYGQFIRLKNPFEENDTAWMFVSEDQSEALVFYFRVLAEASAPLVILKLAGLDETTRYDFEGQEVTGDELMTIGFYIDPALHGDYATMRFHLKAK